MTGDNTQRWQTLYLLRFLTQAMHAPSCFRCGHLRQLPALTAGLSGSGILGPRRPYTVPSCFRCGHLRRLPVLTAGLSGSILGAARHAQPPLILPYLQYGPVSHPEAGQSAAYSRHCNQLRAPSGLRDPPDGCTHPAMFFHPQC